MMDYAKLVGREVVPCDSAHEAFGDMRTPVHVGKDNVGADVMVSTVFLHINHGFSDSEPRWFETMVFGGEHDEWQDRYETYDEAEAGHKRVVEALKAGHSPDSAPGSDNG